MSTTSAVLAATVVPPRDSTMNAPLHPHFTPSSGGPNSDAANGVPAARTASNARRAGWGSMSHGAPGCVVEAELARVHAPRRGDAMRRAR